MSIIDIMNKFKNRIGLTKWGKVLIINNPDSDEPVIYPSDIIVDKSLKSVTPNSLNEAILLYFGNLCKFNPKNNTAWKTIDSIKNDLQIVDASHDIENNMDILEGSGMMESRIQKITVKALNKTIEAKEYRPTAQGILLAKIISSIKLLDNVNYKFTFKKIYSPKIMNSDEKEEVIANE